MGQTELRNDGVLRSPHGPASGEMGLRWSCQGYSGSLLAPEVYGTARGATPLFHLATCGIIRAESSGLMSCSTALGSLVSKSNTFAHSGAMEMRAICL